MIEVYSPQSPTTVALLGGARNDGWGRQRPMLDDVFVDFFECFAQWSKQVLGQSAEEQAPDQVDVTRGCPDDRSPAIGRQFDLRRPPIVRCEVELDQTASFHTLGVMRQAAPLPTDLGSECSYLHRTVWHSAQGVENVVVGQGEIIVRLELAVHFVTQTLLYPHKGEPGTQFVITQPKV